MYWTKRLRSHAFVREVLLAPIEFITHDSLFRIRVFTVALVIGEPLYYFMWTVVSPQPAESLWLRASSALAALPLVFRKTHRVLPKRVIGYYWVALCFYALPFGFFALYSMNGYNLVWLKSCIAMVYVLFHITDWRIAIAQLLVAMPALALARITGLVDMTGPLVDGVPASDLAVLAFAIVTATLFSMSAANLRRERARSALVTMGVLAHEFRTPLTAASMVTERLASEPDPNGTISPCVARLTELHSSMNALIDYQLGNARLLDLPKGKEVVDIGAIAQEAVDSFPLGDPQLRACIAVSCEKGLHALAHRDLLRQVIYNLLSNASNSLLQKHVTPRPQDILVSVHLARPGVIRIEVKDRGIGVEPDRLRVIFEPFHSTSAAPTHGLGLAMCKKAIGSFGGRIYCKSTLGEGATFFIDLPVTTRALDEPPQVVHRHAISAQHDAANLK